MFVSLRNAAKAASVIAVLVPSMVFAEPITNEIQNAPSVIYKIPKDAAIIDMNAPLKGIKFSDTCQIYYKQGAKVAEARGVTFKVANGELIAKEMNGNQGCDNTFEGAYKEYKIKINTATQDDALFLQLRPAKEVVQSQSSVAKIFRLGVVNFEIPEFSLKKLDGLLKNGAIGYVFEIDSPYPPDSIYTNFRRLWKERKNGKSLQYNGKHYEKWYEYKLDEDNNIQCFAEITPYRNGSKAVLSIYLPLTDDGSGVMDVGKQINNAKNILNNVLTN